MNRHVEEDNQEIRLRFFETLFAIYRFYTNSEMDLDEDVAGLLEQAEIGAT